MIHRKLGENYTNILTEELSVILISIIIAFCYVQCFPHSDHGLHL